MPQTANAAAAALTSCLPGFILFNAEKYTHNQKSTCDIPKIRFLIRLEFECD